MVDKKHILCTGGAGYIGSHTVVHLLGSGRFDVTILDNLYNANSEVIQRLEVICKQKINFVNGDMCDVDVMTKLFRDNQFDGVIHYAGLKAVGESVEKPLEYYRVNIGGTLNLVRAMKEANCNVLVFSSSATVYAPCDTLITEDMPLGASNPYGQTKVIIEQILRDVCISDSKWKVSLLRYFNPVGAHPSGLIGESPETPMNLLPYIQQVAVGRRPKVNVFGNDWETDDGTGVRDYLHVEDLALGHIAALDKLFMSTEGLCDVYNLGTGMGVSVMEMIKLFERACGHEICYEIIGRRAGDLGHVVADVGKARKELGWSAARSIVDGCESAWRWQKQNPNGYMTTTECNGCKS